MRFTTFRRNGTDAVAHGAVVDDGIVELGTGSLRGLIERGLPTSVGAPTLNLDEVTLLPPVPDSAKVFAIGLNYVAHREEGGRFERDPYPSVFTKTADSHVGHGETIVKPSVSEQYDYEGELAVVIGRRCHRVAPNDALAHVAGYAVYNDGSVRDWQHHSTQWVVGKSFYRSSAFGPWLVTPDEVGDLTTLTLTTRVNDDVRQKASVSDLIFDVPTVISYLSTVTPLLPGDVIATGTPAGVGSAMKPPTFLQPGDVVEIEISRVGTLRNQVVGE